MCFLRTKIIATLGSLKLEHKPKKGMRKFTSITNAGSALEI